MANAAHLATRSYRPNLLRRDAPGDSLLASLHGVAEPSLAPDPPPFTLEQATSAEAQKAALDAVAPQVRRDIARFVQVLATAETPARLLADPTALKVLLTANGLADQLGDTGQAIRVLLSDPARPGSEVNQVADPRWRGVNNTYDFANKGLAMLRDPAAIEAITNGYAEVLLRAKLDQTTPGLSNALDFLRRASTISNVDQVLSDPTFRAVITTALGVPRQNGQRAIGPSKDGQAISTRIDLTRFKDPSFVNQFTQRYLIAARRAVDQPAEAAAAGRAGLAGQSVGLVF